MRRLLLVALVACKANSTAEAPTQRVAVIPDSITSSLGTVGFALAVDLHRLDVATVANLLPADPPCIRELGKTVGVAVVTQSGDQWQGYVTGVTPKPLRDCTSSFGLVVTDLGSGGSGFGLAREPGMQLATVSWRGDIALVTQGSNAPHAGDPPGVILDLLAQVPRSAKGWLVSSGFPDYKIKSAVAWLETDAKTWTFTITAEASAQGAVKPWLESITNGFSAAAREKHVAIDSAWFTITGTPTTGKLVATIPIAAFQPASP